jgi:uncharacterized protein (TIGR01777 family)
VSPRVAIVGGSGQIGRRLAAALVARGDDVVVLSRDPARARRHRSTAGRVVRWSADDAGGLAGILDSVTAVVNLTGVPVGPWPWTAGRRRAIHDSRIGPTTAIVDAIRRLPSDRRPSVLVNASGTDGYKGIDATPATEATPSGDGFLADLCRDWEEAALAAERAGVRTVVVRIGFVLAPEAKALRLFALPFRLHLGGPLGSGRQWMSWIHVDDVVGLLTLAIDDRQLGGPINAVSPEPARERDVAAALATALHRRSWLAVPAPLIRLVMGQASVLPLGSRRIVPARAVERGYRFRWVDLRSAIEDAVR